MQNKNNKIKKIIRLHENYRQLNKNNLKFSNYIPAEQITNKFALWKENNKNNASHNTGKRNNQKVYRTKVYEKEKKVLCE